MTHETIKSYRDLQVWQRAVALALMIYRLTETFPKTEQYGLSNQMRRAAVSIASNIAEGHSRSLKQFENFLDIARGSLAELDTQTEIAQHIGYVSAETHQQLTNEFNILGRQLTTLRQRLSAHQRPSPNG